MTLRGCHWRLGQRTIPRLFSLNGGCLVAGGVALAGAMMAALLLPARPQPSRQSLDEAIMERELSLSAAEPILAHKPLIGT